MKIPGKARADGSTDLLESWKAIAVYLQRNVRTMQRWELTRGLPVHRLPGGGKPGVFALKSEIHAWRHCPSSVVHLPPAPAIAVLPFQCLSERLEARNFCDGLAEDIISTLARIPALNVAARTSSFAFQGQPQDIRRIGAALKVAWVLEGCVQWFGSRLRVSVQLVDARTGFQCWSERYDQSARALLDLEDEVAGAVVSAITLHALKHPCHRPASPL